MHVYRKTFQKNNILAFRLWLHICPTLDIQVSLLSFEQIWIVLEIKDSSDFSTVTFIFETSHPSLPHLSLIQCFLVKTPSTWPVQVCCSPHFNPIKNSYPFWNMKYEPFVELKRDCLAERILITSLGALSRQHIWDGWECLPLSKTIQSWSSYSIIYLLIM